MKQLTTLMILIFGLGLTSCGKKEANPVCKECGEVTSELSGNGYCQACFEAAKKKAMGGRATAPTPNAGGARPPQPGAVTPFPPQRLAIGNEAPEIEAEDVDGVSFKLSDYRGKVVVLDFWGDW